MLQEGKSYLRMLFLEEVRCGTLLHMATPQVLKQYYDQATSSLLRLKLLILKTERLRTKFRNIQEAIASIFLIFFFFSQTEY